MAKRKQLHIEAIPPGDAVCPIEPHPQILALAKAIIRVKARIDHDRDQTEIEQSETVGSGQGTAKIV